MYAITIAPYFDYALGGVAFFVSVYALVYATISAHQHYDDDDNSTDDDDYYWSNPATDDRGEFVWRRPYTIRSLLLLLYTVTVAAVYSLLLSSFLLLLLLLSFAWSLLLNVISGWPLQYCVANVHAKFRRGTKTIFRRYFHEVLRVLKCIVLSCFARVRREIYYNRITRIFEFFLNFCKTEETGDCSSPCHRRHAGNSTGVRAHEDRRKNIIVS